MSFADARNALLANLTMRHGLSIDVAGLYGAIDLMREVNATLLASIQARLGSATCRLLQDTPCAKTEDAREGMIARWRSKTSKTSTTIKG